MNVKLKSLSMAVACGAAVLSGASSASECSAQRGRTPALLETAFSEAFTVNCQLTNESAPVRAGVFYETSVSGDGEGVATAYFSKGAWRSRLEANAECGPVQRVADGDTVRVFAASCQLLLGGFPYLAVAAEAPGRVLVGEGSPEVSSTIASRLEDFAPDGDEGREAGDLLNVFAGAMRSDGGGDARDISRYSELIDRARIANRENDFIAASEHYRDALALHERIFGDNERNAAGWRESRGDLLLHLALEYSNQLRFLDADALFARAERLLIQSATPFQLAKLKTYRAIHMANQGEREDAAEMALEASTIRQGIAAPFLARLSSAPAIGDRDLVVIEQSAETGSASERLALADVATSENVRGVLLHKSSRIEEALVAFERAEFALEKSRTQIVGDTATALFRQQMYANWANALIDADDADRALALLKRAGAAAGPAAVGSRAEAATYFARGRAFARKGKKSAALEAAEAGFTVLRGLAEDGKYAEVSLDRVQYYLDLLSALGLPTDRDKVEVLDRAFLNFQLIGEVSATSRKLTRSAFILRKEREDPAVRAMVEAFEDARARAQKAELDLAVATSLASEVTGADLAPETLRSFQLAFSEATIDTNAARAQLEEKFPGYFSLNDQWASIDDVRALLTDDEAFVAYATGETGAYAFALTRQGGQVFDTRLNASEMSAMVAELRAPIEARGRFEYDLGRAHLAYRRLLAPAEGLLAGVRRLTVAPDGPLSRLPFSLLVSEDPGEARYDYAAAAFLPKRFAVTATPSAASLVAVRSSNASQAQNPFLGFANFTPPPGDVRFGGASALRQAESKCGDATLSTASFPVLPETEEEVRAIGGMLSADDDSIVTGRRFTKARMARLAGALKDYRTLYFATHGFLPNEYACGELPGLLLSHFNGANAEDLLLTTADILGFELDADLVVLSACNTASGGVDAQRLRVGESLSGLVSAFFEAGARSVVATHWAVPSEQSRDLMISAFRLNAAGGDFAEALRTAQAEFIEAGGETSHPFYWAAYTVNGAGRSRSDVSLLDVPSVSALRLE